MNSKSQIQKVDVSRSNYFKRRVPKTIEAINGIIEKKNLIGVSKKRMVQNCGSAVSKNKTDQIKV